MQVEFQSLVGQAKEMAPRLLTAGENAYRAAPNRNKEVADFLVMVLTDHVRSDRYPQALELAEMLIDNGVYEKNTYVFGGFAAYVLGKYDQAEEYLRVAHEAKLLLDPPPTNQSPLSAMMRYVIRFMSDPEEFRLALAVEQEILVAHRPTLPFHTVMITTRGPIRLSSGRSS